MFPSMNGRIISGLIALVALSVVHAGAQCDPFFPKALSSRITGYEIRAALNDAQHQIEATEVIRFTNPSTEPVSELRIYLYLNAFKNSESSFLKGTSQIFGQSYIPRKAENWGWLEVEKIEQDGVGDISASRHFVQPDDHNPADESVMEVKLAKAIQPGETAVFRLKWKSQMPETIARCGHSKDFYMFSHWFPQLGVYEEDLDGKWGWNCHQFFRSTEFFADFGVYDVYLTTDAKFVVGASGCMLSDSLQADGRITRHFHVEDVIDFAWSAYPHFMVQEEQWKNVKIRLLIPPEHLALAPRYLHALSYALDYLEKHVGPYPYPVITVVDPPFHGLRSGLMEYPTLITVGTFYGMPDGLRMTESLIVHEFTHQYFMGMLASNEKEEAWLDEGFVTYFEDRIIDAAYGDKRGLVDFMGYHFDNRELTRLEYTTMANPREGITARPGWFFSDHNYKPLIYSKTATALRSVQQLIGEPLMDRILQQYFESWKFKHPRGRDFMGALKTGLATLPDSSYAAQVYGLFEKSVYQALVLDYAVAHIGNEILPAPQGVFGVQKPDSSYLPGTGQGQHYARVDLQRKGDWIFPVELLVTFADGSTRTLYWSGEEGSKVFEFYDTPDIVSAQVDPQYKIALDADWNNNSITLKPEDGGLWKYAFKAAFWLQNLFQTLSILS